MRVGKVAEHGQRDPQALLMWRSRRSLDLNGHAVVKLLHSDGRTGVAASLAEYLDEQIRRPV